MPVSDRDIYTTANVLLQHRGLAGALAYAEAQRARLQTSGDLAGVAAWGCIEAALGVLAQEQASDEQTVQ